MERPKFIRKLRNLSIVTAITLTGYGLIESNQSDCEDGIKINNDLYACNTSNGVVIAHKEGGEVLLDDRIVCNTKRVYLDGEEARAYKKTLFNIRSTVIYPKTQKVITHDYMIPFQTKKDC